MIVASKSYVFFCYVMKRDTVGLKRGCVDFVICSYVILYVTFVYTRVCLFVFQCTTPTFYEAGNLGSLT